MLLRYARGKSTRVKRVVLIISSEIVDLERQRQGTYVQSSLWPQKNIVCRRWSAKPSVVIPGMYRHSGSFVSTQVSKSYDVNFGSHL